MSLSFATLTLTLCQPIDEKATFTTRTVTEWYQVVRVLVKEVSKIIGYDNRVQLI